MLVILKSQKTFILSYLLIITLGIFPIFIFNKLDFFIKVNKYHSPIFDNIFYYLTFIGSGYTYIIVFIILTLLKTNNRPLLGAGLGFILLTLVCKSMKLIFFNYLNRPCTLIPENIKIHAVKGIVLKKACGFPSGHAAVIFGMLIFLVFLTNPKWYISSIMLFVAFLVSYSRIYLGQHFYIDVYIGSLIGSLCTITTYLLIMSNNKATWLLDNNLIDQVKFCIKLWKIKNSL